MNDLLKRVHEYHKSQRDMYIRQIELIDSGVMTTRTNNRDTTAETLNQIKEWKAELEKYIAEAQSKYGLD